MLKTVIGFSVAVLVGGILLANVARTSFQKGAGPKGGTKIETPMPAAR